MHFLVGHAQTVLHQLIGFADQLHIAVLDTVVDHLDKVAGAAFAHPVTAGRAVFHLGADGLEDWLHVLPGSGGAAGHHGGTLQSALFAAGNTGADVAQAVALHQGGAAGGVGEVAVAAVDQDVARLQHGDQLFDIIIHRLAGPDHHHDPAGLLQALDKLLQGVGAHDILAGGPAVDKACHGLLGVHVIDGNGKTLVLHVEGQGLAHNGNADQADVGFFHVGFLLFIGSKTQRWTRALPA